MIYVENWYGVTRKNEKELLCVEESLEIAKHQAMMFETHMQQPTNKVIPVTIFTGSIEDLITTILDSEGFLDRILEASKERFRTKFDRERSERYSTKEIK